MMKNNFPMINPGTIYRFKQQQGSESLCFPAEWHDWTLPPRQRTLLHVRRGPEITAVEMHVACVQVNVKVQTFLRVLRLFSLADMVPHVRAIGRQPCLHSPCRRPARKGVVPALMTDEQQ